jgi:hypothetical protein
MRTARKMTPLSATTWLALAGVPALLSVSVDAQAQTVPGSSPGFLANDVQAAGAFGMPELAASPASAAHLAAADQAKRPRGAPPTASAGPSGAVAADASAADQALAAEETGPTSPLPFSINASVGANANLGSMVRPNVQTTDSVSMNFGLGASYSFTDTISVSASASVQKFVTPHGSTRQYEARFGDIYLGANHGNLYTIPVVDIGISGGLSVALPTSDFSRFQGQYLSTGANLGLSRSFGRVSLSYALSASKNFHTYTSVVFNPERYEAEALVRGNGAENISETRVAIDSGILPEWSVSNSLRVAVRLPANFGVSVGFTLSDSFTYLANSLTAEDELQSEFAQTGRGHSQVMVGSIGASYRFLSRFSVGVNMSTAAPPKTADNSRFRFPWFDTQAGNLSYTALSINLGFNY